MLPRHQKRAETLRAKKAQIEAQLAQIDARAKTAKRKAETRRKILIGAVILQEMALRPDFDAWVYKLLEKRLTKDRDRQLFGLENIKVDEA